MANIHTPLSSCTTPEFIICHRYLHTAACTATGRRDLLQRVGMGLLMGRGPLPAVRDFTRDGIDRVNVVSVRKKMGENIRRDRLPS